MAQVNGRDGVRGAAPVGAADTFPQTTARQPVRAKPSSSPHDLPAHGHRLNGGPAGRRALRAIGYGDHGPRRPLLRISPPTGTTDRTRSSSISISPRRSRPRAVPSIHWSPTQAAHRVWLVWRSNRGAVHYEASSGTPPTCVVAGQLR